MSERQRTIDRIIVLHGLDGLAALIAGFVEGRGMSALAREFEVHRVTILRWRKVLGVTRYEPHADVVGVVSGWSDGHGRQTI